MDEIMNEIKRQEILLTAKEFFRDTIAVNHVKNTEKLASLKEFKINPFLDKYLANFAFGDSSAESIAKALVYPRVLGTSITTSFGTNMQNFCNVVLRGYASLVSGIDIEFIDAIDGRKKYCQIKSGPNTINKDDIKSIIDHFDSVRNLARTNRNTDINPTIDCIVGVLYGTFEDISSHYRVVNNTYPVVCGQDFWHRLTGDPNFYEALINAFAEVAVDVDGREVIQQTIDALAMELS